MATNRLHPILWLLLAAAALTGLTGCAPATAEPAPTPPSPTQAPSGATELPASSTEPTGAGSISLELTSQAFAEGEMVPTDFTCDGVDQSPPLRWSGVPEGTQSLALVMDDPDAPAGTWVHWVLFDLPADSSGLPDAVSNQAQAAGGVHGTNSWGELGYGGPCPPSGTHRYVFRLYAADQPLGLAAGATKAQVLAALEGHTLAEAELIGTYSR